MKPLTSYYRSTKPLRDGVEIMRVVHRKQSLDSIPGNSIIDLKIIFWDQPHLWIYSLDPALHQSLAGSGAVYQIVGNQLLAGSGLPARHWSPITGVQSHAAGKNTGITLHAAALFFTFVCFCVLLAIR